MKLLQIGSGALLFCASMLPAAAADKSDPKDAKVVQACLKANKKLNSDACVGVVADPCIGPDEGAKSSSQVQDCLGREKLVWDQILNDSFKTLRDGLDDDQKIKLRDMQRAWIAMRDSTCNFRVSPKNR